jgi:hypothetical protein
MAPAAAAAAAAAPASNQLVIPAADEEISKLADHNSVRQ